MANRVLRRERTGHSKHPLPKTQEKTIHMESPDRQHRNPIDYILCSQRRRSSIQSAKTRPGADGGSDHGQLIAKFRLKLKKVGKTNRPFRYDINQIYLLTNTLTSGPITSWEIDGETVETMSDFIFWAPKSLQMVTAAMKLKDAYSLEGKL